MKRPQMDTRPHFVDLQVNGYAGVDFNADDLSASQLHFACEHCARTAWRGSWPRSSRRSSEDVGPAATNRRHPPARSLGVKRRVGTAHRGAVHQRNARIRRRPSAAARSAGRCRVMKELAGRRLRTDAACHPRAGARSGTEGDPVAGRSARSSSRPGTAIPASTNFAPRSTPGCRCSRTWATAAR